MNKKIMIIGYGSTGKYLLDYLIDNGISDENEITIVTRNAEDAKSNMRLSAMSGIIRNRKSKRDNWNLVECDISNSWRLVRWLENFKPDYVVNTSRYLSGYKYGEYSYKYGIGYGAWSPLAVKLPYAISSAIEQSGITTRFINTSFPDVVNPWLASLDLPIWTGAGNINHLIPRIKSRISMVKNIPLDRIRVHLVGSHYLNTVISKEGTAKGSPYHMDVWIGYDNDGAYRHLIYDLDDYEEIFKHCNLSVGSGAVRNKMIASDCARILELAIHTDYKWKKVSKDIIHLPGFDGLPGGYPCEIRDGVARLCKMIIPFSTAVNINQASLQFDGIENIGCGIITFTYEMINKLEEVYGIKYPRAMHIDDVDMFVEEIKRKVFERGE